MCRSSVAARRGSGAWTAVGEMFERSAWKAPERLPGLGASGVRTGRVLARDVLREVHPRWGGGAKRAEWAERRGGGEFGGPAACAVKRHVRARWNVDPPAGG